MYVNALEFPDYFHCECEVIIRFLLYLLADFNLAITGFACNHERSRLVALTAN